MMNRIVFILTCFLLLLNGMIYAGVPSALTDALNKGSYEFVARYFDTNVDLKILDEEDIYSRAQAELIVKDFFTAHKVKSFSIFHEGGPDGAPYVIGKLVTENGSFRVYFLLKKKGNNLYIQKFRIEDDG